MRLRMRPFLIALTVLALCPATGWSQGPAPERGLPGRERLRDQWDRTGELLERSGPRVAECRDARARALLRAAVEMQERARRAEEAGRYLGALQMTMGARERCLRALRLCGMEETAQQFTERALRRTDEVLARANEPPGLAWRRPPGPARGGPPGPARRGRVLGPPVGDALARAAVLQEEASRAFRDGQYETSLRLTLAARRLTHRAMGPGPRER